jgi:hypothetical protein
LIVQWLLRIPHSGRRHGADQEIDVGEVGLIRLMFQTRCINKH